MTCVQLYKLLGCVQLYKMKGRVIIQTDETHLYKSKERVFVLHILLVVVSGVTFDLCNRMWCGTDKV